MSYIETINALQILDSRGIPTIYVEVTTVSGYIGHASIPSGASTGKYEALELRDEDEQRFLGKSVFKAIENINGPIKKLLMNHDVLDQRGIDELMIKLDATENKSKLGANAILAVSLACADCASNYLDIPLYRYIGGCNAHKLPTPMINIINGGSHASNGLAFQEFMIVPFGNCFSHSIEIAQSVFFNLKKIILSKGLSTAVGDEGGFAPDISNNEEALDMIMEAICKAKYKPGDDVKIALDVAASEFFQDNSYIMNNRNYNSNEMIEYYQKLIDDYPICSIEDGLDQDDYIGWQKLTELLSNKVQLVGDDLFVTNVKRLKLGIKEDLGNSILIKLNQIGTLTETLDCIEYAKYHHYNPIISHRSGETEDTFIADLAVAINANMIKTGSLSRSERIAKYNRLLKIEQNKNR